MVSWRFILYDKKQSVVFFKGAICFILQSSFSSKDNNLLTFFKIDIQHNTTFVIFTLNECT